MPGKSFQAVVEKVVSEGRHGPYAVAYSEDLDMITFSLDRKVWQEKNQPEPGVYVLLSQLTKKRAGWRALRARFVRPADEPAASSTKKKKGASRRCQSK